MYSYFISQAHKYEQQAYRWYARADFYYESEQYGDNLWADKLIERAMFAAREAARYYAEAAIATN